MPKVIMTIEDIAFFEQYKDVVELTPDGLLIRYPQPNQILPEIPRVRKQPVDLTGFEYLGFQNTRRFDNRNYNNKTIGFFRSDGKFEHICERPGNYVRILSQYKHVLTPDLSCYCDMPVIDQWINTYWSRLIGAYWQYHGLIVIPTLSWSTNPSYKFCFSGINNGSVVAVSTIGVKTSEQQNFMNGFIELCRIINPESVICYCPPIAAMHRYANIITVEHEGTVARRHAKRRPIRGQLLIENWK